MPTQDRIYLDNAATSWPKPQTVYDAVDEYQRRLGCSPARSVYEEALRADEEVDAARAVAADLLGAEEPSRVVFTLNCTDALNLAIHGMLRCGDHVVTSAVEHNSVLRPLQWLEQRRVIEVTRVACSSVGTIDPDDAKAALRPNTRLVALVHASNVTGAVQPVAEVGRIAKEHGAVFLVDAAQSIGHMPLAVDTLNVDLLAAPGHKGLLGPLGTGLLYVRRGVEKHLESVRQGGTGTHSDRDVQPDGLPDKYEPGSLNVPGLCGLRAGIEYLRAQGADALRNHESALTERLLDGLLEIPGVTIYGPRTATGRVAVVSIAHSRYSPEDLARRLDAAYRIQVRAGIHCAPRMHQALGTTKMGGTVRFSLGPFNTMSHIDWAVEAVRRLVGEHTPRAANYSSSTMVSRFAVRRNNANA